MNSVSIVVPFYNEIKNLLFVYKTLKKITKYFRIKNYEIIFVNDGSSDLSENVILNLKKKDKKIFLICHKKNLGLGAAIKSGLKKCKYKIFIWVPGDNEHNFDGLKPLFEEVSKNKYDIIIPYPLNNSARKLIRIVISKLYTFFLNVLFFKRLPYYNGLCVYKTKNANKIIKNITNSSMTYLSEFLIRSLINTNNYKIIGYKLNPSQRLKKTEALKIKNILLGLYFILRLRIELLFK